MTPTSSADPRQMDSLMLAANPSWEAVVHASADGLPIRWQPPALPDVERLTQAAVALYQAGILGGFLRAENDRQVSLETDFGRLQVTPREDGTLVLVFERTDETGRPPPPRAEPGPKVPAGAPGDRALTVPGTDAVQAAGAAAVVSAN